MSFGAHACRSEDCCPETLSPAPEITITAFKGQGVSGNTGATLSESSQFSPPPAVQNIGHDLVAASAKGGSSDSGPIDPNSPANLHMGPLGKVITSVVVPPAPLPVFNIDTPSPRPPTSNSEHSNAENERVGSLSTAKDVPVPPLAQLVAVGFPGSFSHVQVRFRLAV